MPPSSWLGFVLVALQPTGLPAGDGKIEVDVGAHKLDAFTYRPEKYKDGPLIVVFHGMLRNADTYRDNAKGLGDRFGALIVSPLFDAKRFPNEAYQQGGLFKKKESKKESKKELQAKEDWTWSLVPKLVDEVRRREGRPDMPCYYIGHSAGGQFLVRLTGFLKSPVQRIVAANPGAELFPTREMPFPYGFGKLPDQLNGDAALERFLAQPLTIYVGSADTEHKNLDLSDTAKLQGANRYERGKNCFKAAQDLAKSKGWKLNWRLVEAEGVGHDARLMFEHPNCAHALFGKSGR